MAEWISVPKSGETSKHAYCVGRFVRLQDIPEGLVKNWNDFYGNDDLRKHKKGSRVGEKKDDGYIHLQTSPDYSCYITTDKGANVLKETHARYAHFPITHLLHDTKRENVLTILINETMKKGRVKKYKLSEKEQSYHFSWWGLAFDENQTKNYRESMTKAINIMLRENETKHQQVELLSSHPFSGTAKDQYERWRFSVPVDELLNCYKDSVGEYETRILCTEVYAHEVMHTVLVHPTIMNEEFKEDLPTLDDYMTKEPNPVVKKDGAQLVWHPQSTSIRHPDIEWYKYWFKVNKNEIKPRMQEEMKHKSKLKQWDHLTFALLIPEDRDGIRISPEVLIKNLQILVKETQGNESDEMEAFLNKEMSKCTSPRIWDIIPLFAERSNATCILETLINIVQMNLKKLSPEEIKQQEDKIEEALFKLWDIIEINLFKEKLPKMRDQCNNIKKFTELFRKTFGQLFPETLAKYNTKVQTVVDKFWNVIQESLTEEMCLKEIHNQCVKIEKLNEIVRENLGKNPEHEEKLRASIAVAWKVIKTKQSEEELVAEASGSISGFHLQDGIGYLQDAVENVLGLITRTLPLDEWLAYSQNIQLSVEAIKNMHIDKRYYYVNSTNERKDIFYKMVKRVFVNLWDKIQDYKIRDQCDNIKKLFEIVRKMLRPIFPREIPEHKEKRSEAIIEVWRKLVKEVQEMTEHNNDDKALEDGIKALGDNIERVSELTMELCPNVFLDNFKHCLDAVNVGVPSDAKDFVGSYKSLWRRLCKIISLFHLDLHGDFEDIMAIFHACFKKLSPKEVMEEVEEKDKFKAALVDLRKIIQEKSVSNQINLNLIPFMCEIELILKNFPQHEENLQKPVADIWDIMTKLIKDKFVTGCGVADVTDALEHVSKFTMTMLPPEEFGIHYRQFQEAIEEMQSDNIQLEEKQNLLSRVCELYGKYQEEKIDSQSPRKRKSDDSATSQKRQRESENDSETSEKRQCESSDHSE